MGLILDCCVTPICCTCRICLGCCSGCCSCCGRARTFARIGYIIFSLCWIIFSIVMLFYGDYVFDYFNKYMNCPSDSTKDSCLQISAIYRTSFALAVFHFLMFLICLCKGKIPTAIHEGAWPIKVALVVALYIVTFVIDNSFFKVYGYIAMVASGFFLLYHIILIIDMAYTWNNYWVGAYDSANERESGYANCWMILLIVFTVIFYAAALVICILLYANYNDLWWYVFLTTITIIAGVTYTALIVFRVAEKGSIFTCGLIFVFTSGICASSILSSPNLESRRAVLTEIFIGLIFLFFILFYVAGISPAGDAATAAAAGNQKAVAEPNAIAQAAGPVMDKKDEVNTSAQPAAEPARPGNYGAVQVASYEELPDMAMTTALFHLFMTFAALYYAMVLTNWGSLNIADDRSNYKDFANEWLGFAMKVTAQWVATLLFIWTLIAPRVCPGRDFS